MEVEINIDGGSRGNPGPSAIGAVIRWPDRLDFRHCEHIGDKTNNEAEYAALIWVLDHLKYTAVRKLKVYCDSLLIVNQFNGLWCSRDPRMKKLRSHARGLASMFDSVIVQHIPREQNAEADALVNEALDAYEKHKITQTDSVAEVAKTVVPNCL